MNTASPVTKTKELLKRDIMTSCVSLVLASLMTFANLIYAMVNEDMLLPYAVSIPFYLLMTFAQLCGMRSDAFYATNFGENWQSELSFQSPSVYYTVVVICFVLTAALAVLAILSVKNKRWSRVAMVAFSADGLLLLIFTAFVYGFGRFTLLEIVSHAWFIYYAYKAYKTWDAMEKAPSAKEVAAKATAYGSEALFASSMMPPQEDAVDAEEETVSEDETKPLDEAPSEEAGEE